MRKFAIDFILVVAIATILFMLFCSVFSYGQSITNKSSHATYPNNIQVQSIIDQKSGDTLAWYWNRSEVQSYVQSKVHDSSYYNTPIYGLGAFSSASVYTVTTTKVKSNSLIQVGWYGTSAIHTNTATSIYVPSSSRVDGTRFNINASQSQSDSFYYFIWNHY